MQNLWLKIPSNFKRKMRYNIINAPQQKYDKLDYLNIINYSNKKKNRLVVSSPNYYYNGTNYVLLPNLYLPLCKLTKKNIQLGTHNKFDYHSRSFFYKSGQFFKQKIFFFFLTL